MYKRQPLGAVVLGGPRVGQDQLPQQRPDGDHGGGVEGQRVEVRRQADGVQVGTPVRAVLVHRPGRDPQRPGGGRHPCAGVGGDGQHPGTGVGDLVVVVPVRVDPDVGVELADARRGPGRVADFLHHPAIYRKRAA